MPVTCIDDVNLNARDAAAVPIVEIYAKNSPDYAVYRTPRRVMVQYADDPDLARAQRAALAPLNPLRGVINSLLDGWKRSRVERFSRGVADALVVALEGDPAGAGVILQNVKQEIIDERTSSARFSYLTVGVLMAAVWILLMAAAAHSAWVATILSLPKDAKGVPSVAEIWQAGSGGAVGAYFSIATAMRKRTVLTDLQWLDNTADAMLRITIGVIAALLLFCLLGAHMVDISFPSVSSEAGKLDRWMWVLVIGFTAGFLERLVPDLLEKTTLATASSAHPSPLASSKLADRVVAPVVTSSFDPADFKDDWHMCDDGEGVTLANATPDDQLPPAVGGVATTA